MLATTLHRKAANYTQITPDIARPDAGFFVPAQTASLISTRNISTIMRMRTHLIPYLFYAAGALLGLLLWWVRRGD